MLALKFQGLIPGNIHPLGFALDGNRCIVLPVDLVGIEKQFVFPWEGVIKDRHLFVSHDNQFLLLETDAARRQKYAP